MVVVFRVGEPTLEKGATLRGKNLLSREQIFSFKISPVGGGTL